MTGPAAYPPPGDSAAVIDVLDWTGTQRPRETLVDLHARRTREDEALEQA